MQYGFIKVAAGAPKLTVADVDENLKNILAMVQRAQDEHVNLLALPELCLTGYTCGDLFYSEVLLNAAEKALCALADATTSLFPVIVAGVPIRARGKLYNCAAVVHDGKILGLVPKTYLPNYGEFYELRQFTSAVDAARPQEVCINGIQIPFTERILFECSEKPEFTFGVEICEDLWTPDPPSRRLAQAGAAVIVNPSASDEVIGKKDYRRLLVRSTSARLLCGYVYASAGTGESTQDMVFAQHQMIAECGTILSENPPFGDCGWTTSELDVDKTMIERHRMTGYSPIPPERNDCLRVAFSQPIRETELTRTYPKTPFVPASDQKLAERAEEILSIQSYGLKKRVEHTRARSLVIGVSGGLDSALALLVAVRTMDLLNRDRRDILAVSMPCFGTTNRTRSNAQALAEKLGVSFREVDITSSVRSHFADIQHDEGVRDVTYENGQARERTQVLMDLANQFSGMVVGTGDLSELALGWATYNGDHMSMYGVNAGVPKTLVRYIVRYEAGRIGGAIGDVLVDILKTPVSPELLPATDEGEIRQRTEDLVGPYELHDFFLYYAQRFGFSPKKIFHLAKRSFSETYSEEVILKWLQTFFRRFFASQFKRSCLPDGPKVGSVTLSPRGDWRMPSDASGALWLREIDELTEKSLKKQRNIDTMKK